MTPVSALFAILGVLSCASGIFLVVTAIRVRDPLRKEGKAVLVAVLLRGLGVSLLGAWLIAASVFGAFPPAYVLVIAILISVPLARLGPILSNLRRMARPSN